MIDSGLYSLPLPSHVFEKICGKAAVGKCLVDQLSMNSMVNYPLSPYCDTGQNMPPEDGHYLYQTIFIFLYFFLSYVLEYPNTCDRHGTLKTPFFKNPISSQVRKKEVSNEVCENQEVA